MLAYELKGSGPPLVLIHAFPLSGKMWADTAPLFQKNFTVICPDLPGFGNSPRQSKPSIAGIAAEVAALLDHLKITEPVRFGGLSMGGYLAFEFLRQFPKRLHRLGLFATRATPDSPEGRENRLRSIESLEKFGMEPFAKKIVKNQLGKSTQEQHPEVMQKALELMIKNSPQGAADALHAMAERRDSSDLLGGIRIPVLVVAGEEDTISPAAEMEAMHKKISGSEFHRVPKSGHLINLEQPEIFHRILKDFFAK